MKMAYASIKTISKELKSLSLSGVKRSDSTLGSGAYGKVFAVKFKGKKCAAKEIHSVLLESASPEEKLLLKENFLKECYQCSKLCHPNIVQFIGIYYSDRYSILPVMVMELMDISLTKYIKMPDINMNSKISILHDVSQGMCFLHCRASPIIHRDLTPNNILLLNSPSNGLVAKISDLGVAKVVKHGTKTPVTKLTTAPGTADFMPPEALTDEPKYSTALDIFSYGGVILHVVSQVWPTPAWPIATALDPGMNVAKVFTEVERRQKYLDKTTAEEAGVLKILAVSCLDNDPKNRPATTNVVDILEELKLKQGPAVNKVNERKPSMRIVTGQYAMLLEAKVGCKVPHWMRDFRKSVRRQLIEVPVVSGTLLKALNEREMQATSLQYNFTFNYKVLFSDNEIWVRCEAKETKPLSFEEIKLLEAVRSVGDRVRLLHKLDWVGSLSPESNVILKNMHGRFDHPVKAVIHYIGDIPGRNQGTHFGVELMECRGYGNNNGSCQGQQLFRCSQNCGLFVSMDKLLNEHEIQPAKHQPIQQQLSVTDERLFEKSDRVVVCDMNNKSVEGTVKWTGRDTIVLPNGAYIVGIDTDQDIHDLTFPNRIMMNCPMECSSEPPNLFLPVSHVKKIADHYDNKEQCTQSLDWQDALHSNMPQLYLWRKRQASDFEPHIQNDVSPLEVNDAVKVGGSYGTIKYIGELPGYKEKMAGVEMEEPIPNATDGQHEGYVYFKCAPETGTFVRLDELRWDDRFSNP